MQLIESRGNMRNLYIACEDMNHIWLDSQVAEMREFWRQGYDIAAIAKHFKRDMDEVAILIIDQKRLGFIKNRKGGAFGSLTGEVESQSKNAC